MNNVAEILLKAAEKFPHRTAIRDRTGEYSYQDLDAWSNAVAGQLWAQGVRRNDRVGIWLDKSAAAFVAMQGILRLGAAYVPLDPLSPVERIRTIAHNCDLAAVIVAQEDDKESIGVKTVQASYTRRPETESRADFEQSLAPSTELAYVLYTSGSTGTPKGVCISHRNALAFIFWAAANVEATAEDHFSNHAPFHFDLSVFDLYVPAMVGARLSIVPEGSAYSPTQLVEHIVGEKITVWYSVPSVLILMMERGDLLGQELNWRCVIFAGEPFPISPLKRLVEACPHTRFFNYYGPTETNVCAAYELPGGAEDLENSVPIGTASSGDSLRVLKPDGSEAIPGESGELLVSGPTVMLGYWGATDQPAEWYPTGDLVSIRSDGNLLYLGRSDNMVKVRGHRIELPEIEAIVGTHPAVQDVAVAVVGTGIDAKLVAVVARRPDESLSLIRLKEHCAKRLPRHMIIDSLVPVERLPRTRNGKIDRARVREILRNK